MKTKNKTELMDVRKANALLSAILESPEDVIIFALDRGYRYIRFNTNHKSTMKAIWGADIEIGQSILNYIPSIKDREKAKINFDRALAGESIVLEEEYGHADLERRYFENRYNPIRNELEEIIGVTVYLTDITERKMMMEQRNKLIQDLQNEMAKVSTLSGLLPICANCKKIQDDEGDWQRMEAYIRDHSTASVSHSICPECAQELYPEYCKAD